MNMAKPGSSKQAWMESRPGSISPKSVDKHDHISTINIGQTNHQQFTRAKTTLGHQTNKFTDNDNLQGVPSGTYIVKKPGGKLVQDNTQSVTTWYIDNHDSGSADDGKQMEDHADRSHLSGLTEEEKAKKMASIDCKLKQFDLSKISKMEKEINQLKQELDTKSKQLEDLEKYYKSSCAELENCKQKVTKLQHDIDEKQKKIDKHEHKAKQTDGKRDEYTKKMLEDQERLRNQLHELGDNLREVENEKRRTEDELKETQTRLSRLMGSKLRDGNADIADLSDENRPTKISEKFSELYDNQWTDAYEVLQKHTKDVKIIVAALLDILISVKQHCDAMVDNLTAGLVSAITFSSTDKEVGVPPIPDHINKQLKDLKRTTAGLSTKTVFNSFMGKAKQLWQKPNILHKTLNEKPMTAYIKECTRLCWLMCVQDPPLVLGVNFKPADRFDSTALKEYLTAGPVLEFLVWPPLYLKQDGPLLSRGIAQGMQPSGQSDRTGSDQPTATPRGKSAKKQRK